MSQSPPILIYSPGGGVSSPIGSNPPVYSQAGTTALVEGQDYLDVVFGSIQTNDEWVLVGCIVVNELDVDPLNLWPGIITDRTESGFRIYFNGLPDSGNYYLYWSVSGINIEPSLATTYYLTGPATGGPGEAVTYTVSLPPSTYVNASVTVTPSEGGLEIGVFSPETVTLTTDSPSATFTFTPALYGETTITVNNDRGLTDPADLAFTVVADTYELSGPSAGDTGVESTDFTVELPVGGAVVGTVTVTPDDGSDGAFTPTTVGLTTAAPSDTFTYTPASAGTKTISVTNDGGLTDPDDISYESTAPFDPTTIAGLKGWWKADAITSSLGLLKALDEIRDMSKPAPEQEKAGVEPLLADGTALSGWLDSSGNGFHMTGVGFPVYKTNIINGLPAVRFTGTEAFNNTAAMISGNYTIFVVASLSTISSQNTFFASGTAASGCAVTFQTYLDAYYLSQYNGSFTQAGELTAVVIGQWNVLTGNWDGTNIHLWRNGTLKSTLAIASITRTGTDNSIAYDHSSGALNPFHGDIAEILVYNSAISTPDREAVEDYLATKYGL